MKLKKHIFMGHNGNKMDNNTEYYLTLNIFKIK